MKSRDDKGTNTTKKMVEEITSMREDFAQWYTDIVKKTELIDYSSVRGCMILRPYGYAIWENIQRELNKMFVASGHENVYMPMFIPESLLRKEKEHVEGFAPEVAWVTHGGDEELTEKLCVRPTSETLFCEHYANIIHSYRDLPKLYNQWCSVVRWEKTTRPFLRTLEFLWQEGHTAHADADEAQEETLRMLDTYAGFCEKVLSIPVIRGRKSDKEKFAGAKATYSVESLMHDGKALQSATSHNFGDGFARAFGIQYTDKENKLQYVHQTSWGMSTRIIGAIIMVHGDDSGLVLPPAVAPIQTVVIPVSMHKEGVLSRAESLKAELAEKYRTVIDKSDKQPGWKFSEYEMKGVPIRIEIGPRDIEKGEAVLVRRDNGEKIQIKLDEISEKTGLILNEIQSGLYKKALKLREDKTYIAADPESFKKILEETPGFVKAMWCGNPECEAAIKESTGATSRCIPFEQEELSDKCIYCGGRARKMVYWAKAY
ncbi:MAG: proline--tRNA ligase [Eubacteriales bacterium]|nr:proline--tRNA ligase [Eubacteriales bacterium]